MPQAAALGNSEALDRFLPWSQSIAADFKLEKS
jgi:hypothetical protein